MDSNYQDGDSLLSVLIKWSLCSSGEMAWDNHHQKILHFFKSYRQLHGSTSAYIISEKEGKDLILRACDTVPMIWIGSQIQTRHTRYAPTLPPLGIPARTRAICSRKNQTSTTILHGRDYISPKRYSNH